MSVRCSGRVRRSAHSLITRTQQHTKRLLSTTCPRCLIAPLRSSRPPNAATIPTLAAHSSTTATRSPSHSSARLQPLRTFSSASTHDAVGNLTPDQQEFREAVRKWAEAEVAPLAADIDRNNAFPSQLWRAMGEMGFLGVTAPTEYGGSGLGYLEHLLIVEEISRCSGSVGLSYAAHSNLCVNQIVRNASDAQKSHYLPKLISGEHVGALAMSEPGAGSDVLGMKLTATQKGDKWVSITLRRWKPRDVEAVV